MLNHFSQPTTYILWLQNPHCDLLNSFDSVENLTHTQDPPMGSIHGQSLQFSSGFALLFQLSPQCHTMLCLVSSFSFSYRFQSYCLIVLFESFFKLRHNLYYFLHFICSLICSWFVGCHIFSLEIVSGQWMFKICKEAADEDLQFACQSLYCIPDFTAIPQNCLHISFK